MAALGFIETKGLLAAVEGADAMLKAADVHLVEKNLVGGGLVSITIAGEVSAVKASVDAAVSAVGRISGTTLVSRHVIARPDEELERIIATKQASIKAEYVDNVLVDIKEASVEIAGSSGEAGSPSEDVPEKDPESHVKADPSRYEISDLEKMKISRLRQIARTMSGLSLTREEIKSSAKKALIEAIIKVTGR